MTHFNNAVAAYRYSLRCKSEGRDYEAGSYYDLARHFASVYAEEIGSNRLNVMWDVLDHMIENPSNS